jgi:Alcohol dehydrogenase GroES-like domain
VINDVLVQIHASGFIGDELTLPSRWTDRVGRDRTPSIPGHELAGVVTALGYGTTGLSIDGPRDAEHERAGSITRHLSSASWVANRTAHDVCQQHSRS